LDLHWWQVSSQVIITSRLFSCDIDFEPDTTFPFCFQKQLLIRPLLYRHQTLLEYHWIPAFAGMTKRNDALKSSLRRRPESSPGVSNGQAAKLMMPILSWTP
jgi:hypothetical protein